MILGEIPDEDIEGASSGTDGGTSKPVVDVAKVTAQFEAFIDRLKADTPDPIVRSSMPYRFKRGAEVITLNRSTIDIRYGPVVWMVLFLITTDLRYPLRANSSKLKQKSDTLSN